MSRFGLLMGDFEDDPFFGAHMQSMQRMNSMMNSMFDPFGMMGGPAAMMGNQQMGNQQRQLQMPGMQMMPFGFPPMGMNINRMISDLQNMSNNPNCHSFTSSSVMTMTTGPDGRPQVYQESMSSRTGPGGIKETKQTVSDSRTGTRKMAIGHHIGERAHIIEREKNEYTGDQEERQDFINLEEEEAETFNQEWERKARRTMPSVGPAITNGYNRHHNDRLALPSTVPSGERKSKSPSAILASPKRAIKNALSSKKNKNKNKIKDPTRSAESTNTSTSNSASSSSSSSKADPSSESPEDLSSTSSSSEPIDNNNYNSSTGRKREHSPEIEEIENPNHKRRSHGTTSDN